MKTFSLFVFMILAFLAVGCDSVDPERAYSTQLLYDDNIETVCVEMFDSDSFRRGVEYDLTMALVNRIGANTPYKICQDRKEADTVIYGRILNVNERILNQQRELDRPMQEQVLVEAEVTWKDLRSGELLMDKQRFRFSGNYAALMNDSVEAASREAVNKMAVDIVNAMEVGW